MGLKGWATMDRSSARALTTAQQLARLKLSRFFSEGSGLTASTRPDETATSSSRGGGAATGDGPVVALAWEIAQTAQFCAYLAIELQVWAEKYAGRESISADSTYRRLSDSLGIFRGLLNNMQVKFSKLNKEEGNTYVCAISEPLVEAILSMWAADNLTTLVECMTSTERAETLGTSDAGDTK
jgi:hypothetical protein